MKTTTIAVALLAGAAYLCGFGSHAIYASSTTEDNAYNHDNSFISLMHVVAQDEPALWAKVEASPEWEAFATAYDKGDGSKEAEAVWNLLCGTDTTAYVADCLSGTDEYEAWMMAR